MIFNLIRNKKALSLVEMMVALGVSSMVSLAIMKLNEDQLKTVNRIVTDSDLRMFVHGELRFALGRANVCNANFAGVANVRYSDGINPLTAQSGGSSGELTLINRLANDGVTPIPLASTVAPNNLVAGNNWRVLEMSMLPYRPSAASYFNGICPIRINLERVKNLSYGARTREFTLNLACLMRQPNPIGTPAFVVIDTCVLEEAAKEGFWERHFAGGMAFINYDNNPGGYVSIGQIPKAQGVVDFKPDAPLEIFGKETYWYFPLNHKAIGIPKNSVYGFLDGATDSQWAITETGPNQTESQLEMLHFNGASVSPIVTHTKTNHNFARGIRVSYGDVEVPDGSVIVGERLGADPQTPVFNSIMVGRGKLEKNNFVMVGDNSVVDASNSMLFGSNILSNVNSAAPANWPDDNVATAGTFGFGRNIDLLAPNTFGMGAEISANRVDSVLIGRGVQTGAPGNPTGHVMGYEGDADRLSNNVNQVLSLGIASYNPATTYNFEELVYDPDFRVYMCKLTTCPAATPLANSTTWETFTGTFVIGQEIDTLASLGSYVFGRGNISGMRSTYIGQFLGFPPTLDRSMAIGVGVPEDLGEDLGIERLGVKVPGAIIFSIQNIANDAFINLFRISPTQGLVFGNSASAATPGNVILAGSNNLIEPPEDTRNTVILGGHNINLQGAPDPALERVVSFGGHHNSVDGGMNISLLNSVNAFMRESFHSTMMGGYNNSLEQSASSFMIGGRDNRIIVDAGSTGHGSAGTVGGIGNTIRRQATSAYASNFIIGGMSNTSFHDEARRTMIIGGNQNQLGGGTQNQNVTVIGGALNNIYSAPDSVFLLMNNSPEAVMPGSFIDTHSGGNVVLGGYGIHIHNSTMDSTYFGSMISHANALGGIYLADHATAPSAWQGLPEAPEIVFRFKNGYEFLLSAGVGQRLPHVGPWEPVSSKKLKTNVEALDDEVMLSKLRELEIYRYHYISEKRLNPSGQRVSFLGPMAQDFYQAFKVGSDDVSIGEMSIAGVGLKMAQALVRRMDRIEAKLNQQHSLLDKLKAYISYYGEKLIELKNSLTERDRKIASLKVKIKNLKQQNNVNRELLERL